MTQNDLNRAVAAATGETVSEISHRGFQPLPAAEFDHPADAAAAFLRQSRHPLPMKRRHRQPAVA